MMHNNDSKISEYFDEKTELVNTLSKLTNSGTYVFRGYNTQDQLLPSIIRGGKTGEFADVENELLSDFEKYGSHYFSANTPIDFMSYGQHYGLPTRLLDFTYNPFIALRFALFSAKSSGKYTKNPEDADYYYIRFCKIDDNIHLKSLPIYRTLSFGNFESDSMAKKCSSALRMYSSCLCDPKYKFFPDYLKGLYDCDYHSREDFDKYKFEITLKIQNRKLCFIDPSQSNQRIIMQQGLFMLPYTLNKDTHYELIENNTSVLKIHKSLREPLLAYLDTLGYNAFRLMPDLTSVCEAVKQKIKDERSISSELFKKKFVDESNHIKIRNTKRGYKFDVIAKNRQLLATSEIYDTFDLCKDGVAHTYEAISSPVEDQTELTYEVIDGSKYELYTDRVGEFRFRLKSENNAILLVSEGYKTKPSCLNAINSIKNLEFSR